MRDRGSRSARLTAEIVLEGYVHLDELRTEGPFGDHTGFYSLEDLYPVSST